MPNQEFTIRLEGVDAKDVAAAVVRDLCEFVVEGSMRCARLAAEGRSVGRGTVPAWVASVADVRIAGFVSGSLVMNSSAPRLVDAAPEQFAQPSLFGVKLEPNATAVDLLISAVSDAEHGRVDSDALDAGVLEVLVRAGQLFARGGTRLSLGRPGGGQVFVERESISSFRALADQTPAPRTTRVRGVLDTATVSSRSFAIRIADGTLLRGGCSPEQFDQIRALLGEDVVVEGTTTFRPSGAAMRIDADFVARATERDAVWARAPRVDPRTASLRPGPNIASLADLFGTWPGDETEEELTAALADLA